MALELEIANETNDVWGVPPDNEVKRDGLTIVIKLEKLKYMVRFLDTYARQRAHMSKRKRPTMYSSPSLVHGLFQNEIYRDYRIALVRDRFYVAGDFTRAIDSTVNAIEHPQE